MMKLFQKKNKKCESKMKKTMKRSMMMMVVFILLLLVTGCESMFYKNMEDVELDGTELKAKYFAPNQGVSNTTNFLLYNVYFLTRHNPEAETLTLDVTVVHKDGEDQYIGRFDFDDLDKIRTRRNKGDYAKNSLGKKSEIKEILIRVLKNN